MICKGIIVMTLLVGAHHY